MDNLKIQNEELKKLILEKDLLIDAFILETRRLEYEVVLKTKILNDLIKKTIDIYF